jgi:hypothetical protein
MNENECWLWAVIHRGRLKLAICIQLAKTNTAIMSSAVRDVTRATCVCKVRVIYVSRFDTDPEMQKELANEIDVFCRHLVLLFGL